jgi:hypothetical protein
VQGDLSWEKLRQKLEDKMLAFRERTHADNVELEERDNLLLYVK